MDQLKLHSQSTTISLLTRLVSMFVIQTTSSEVMLLNSSDGESTTREPNTGLSPTHGIQTGVITEHSKSSKETMNVVSKANQTLENQKN